MSSRGLRRLVQECEPQTQEEPCCITDSEYNDSMDQTSKFSLLPVDDFTNNTAFSDTNDNEELELNQKKKKKSKNRRPRKLKCSDAKGVLNTTSVSVEKILTSCKRPTIEELLHVNIKNLDPMVELSRLFGSHVIHGESRCTQHRQSNNKRGLLVRIKSTWPPVVRFGLDMVKLTDGTFTFEHNKEYENTQKLFYRALNSMDPNNIVQILTNCPYHIDSLLQLSDILLHQDNIEMSIDLLERALHAYQSGFHPSFNPAAGVSSLNYDRQENRGLFVALFRYLSLLGSRGCYGISLDYCKMLFRLDMKDDPVAVLLIIDHYALMSKQMEFLIHLYEELNPSRNLYLLPNFAFSIALAVKLMTKNVSPSPGDRNPDSLLQDALIMFPGFVTRLLKYTAIGGVTNLDKSAHFGKEIESEPPSLGRLLDLYVTRSHLLWTAPDAISWLELNIEAVLKITEVNDTNNFSSRDPRLSEYSERRRTLYPTLPLNVQRHLVLANVPEAPPLLSRMDRHFWCTPASFISILSIFKNMFPETMCNFPDEFPLVAYIILNQ